jgi:hypothetical protein
VQLQYIDSIDNDFSLLLRERRSTTVGTMMSDTIEVEVNLMASGKIKQNFDINGKKPQGDVHHSTSRSSDEKFYLMMKTMEKMMERISMDNKPTAREKNDFQPINQNFIRALVPRIRQRDQREKGDQKIRPPFQKNYANEYSDQMIQDQMHCCDDMDTHMFLTKGEHDQFMDTNDGIMLEIEDTLSSKIEEFNKGYHKEIMKFQKKYNLGSRKTSAEPHQMNPTREPQANNPSVSRPKK